MTEKTTPAALAELTRDEKSILLYAETCLVDGGGLMAGARMNEADIAALKKFRDGGILDFGRIPFHTIEKLIQPAVPLTHWVTFHDRAWELAHALRRQRASNGQSPNRKKVDAALAEKVEATHV